ncbi:hypothetical protein P3447_08700 [Vibrio parahaemolyticus]|nr:hypothetical protein [Vibrio parahaemolyticus]
MKFKHLAWAFVAALTLGFTAHAQLKEIKHPQSKFVDKVEPDQYEWRISEQEWQVDLLAKQKWHQKYMSYKVAGYINDVVRPKVNRNSELVDELVARLNTQDIVIRELQQEICVLKGVSDCGSPGKKKKEQLDD